MRPGFAARLDRCTRSLDRRPQNDSPNLVELRARLFGVLGYYGKDPQILAEASKITERYLADPTSEDPNLGQTAMAIAARNGDAALFDKLQHVAETSANPEFQEGALRLLAEFEDPKLAARSLNYAISGKVRSQDASIQIAVTMEDEATRDQAWKFIRKTTGTKDQDDADAGDGRDPG